MHGPLEIIDCAMPSAGPGLGNPQGLKISSHRGHNSRDVAFVARVGIERDQLVDSIDTERSVRSGES